MRLFATLAVAGGLALGLALAASQAPAAAPARAVRIANFTFDPVVVQVPVGGTVTWTNADDSPHTVTAVDKSFRSRALDSDERFSFTFTRPGVYSYFCALHPMMTAKVVVG